MNNPDFDTLIFDPTLAMKSEPVLNNLAAWAPARRRQLLEEFRAGTLTELEFEAVVFRQGGKNRNPVAFRDEDLPAFAASFEGQPFLRNHDVADIASRDGTIVASRMAPDPVRGPDMVQTIRLTSQRGIRDFLEGRIDRFSIGWYFDEVQCNICGGDWLHCPHTPGKQYAGRTGAEAITCKLIFIRPAGKETSAVNAPAVDSTRVLTQLSAYKEQISTMTLSYAEKSDSTLSAGQTPSAGRTLPAGQADALFLPDGSKHPVPPRPSADARPETPGRAEADATLQEFARAGGAHEHPPRGRDDREHHASRPSPSTC